MTVFASDLELLRRFRAGDREALSTVYWFYIDRVEGTLRRGLRMAHGDAATRSADLADLVQEVFIRAFAEPARRAYDSSRPYAPFLMTIARHALVDLLRRSSRERNVELSRLELLMEQEAPDESEQAPWADPSTMALVQRYVEGLSAQERSVYDQRYTRNRSQEQSAEALGLSRQQVRTLEARVRTGLVRELARAKLRSGGQAGAYASAMDEGQ
jgi:RNA polymerase sigma factor (sigma-70 family)